VQPPIVQYPASSTVNVYEPAVVGVPRRPGEPVPSPGGCDVVSPGGSVPFAVTFNGPIFAWSAGVAVANLYMSLFGRLRIDIKSEGLEAKVKELEAKVKEKELAIKARLIPDPPAEE
jgi:hypothetical protein